MYTEIDLSMVEFNMGVWLKKSARLAMSNKKDSNVWMFRKVKILRQKKMLLQTSLPVELYSFGF